MSGRLLHGLVLLLASSFPTTMADQTIQPPAPQGQAQVIAGLDEIALTTVRLEMYAGETRAGTATGFFFRDDKRLFLLTNRHIVRDEEKVFKPDYLLLRLHTNSEDLAICESLG
jgi:S1-C subfamily serine protease